MENYGPDGVVFKGNIRSGKDMATVYKKMQERMLVGRGRSGGLGGMWGWRLGRDVAGMYKKMRERMLVGAGVGAGGWGAGGGGDWGETLQACTRRCKSACWWGRGRERGCRMQEFGRRAGAAYWVLMLPPPPPERVESDVQANPLLQKERGVVFLLPCPHPTPPKDLGCAYHVFLLPRPPKDLGCAYHVFLLPRPPTPPKVWW